MARKKPDKFRYERAIELETLALILLKQQICRNSSPLDKAAARCRNDKPKGENSWGYHLDGLLFRINTPRHTWPTEIGDYLDLELSVSLKGICEIDSDDPFQHELSVSIVVSTNEVSSGRKNLCAWHLDRHISGAKDHEPDEVHPLYHFHHGGECVRLKIWVKSYYWTLHGCFILLWMRYSRLTWYFQISWRRSGNDLGRMGDIEI